MLVEGFLNVSWGVQRPIRLKIQDDKQALPIASPISSNPVSPVSPLGGERSMRTWTGLTNRLVSVSD